MNHKLYMKFRLRCWTTTIHLVFHSHSSEIPKPWVGGQGENIQRHLFIAFLLLFIPNSTVYAVNHGHLKNAPSYQQHSAKRRPSPQLLYSKANNSSTI